MRERERIKANGKTGLTLRRVFLKVQVSQSSPYAAPLPAQAWRGNRDRHPRQPHPRAVHLEVVQREVAALVQVRVLVLVLLLLVLRGELVLLRGDLQFAVVLALRLGVFRVSCI